MKIKRNIILVALMILLIFMVIQIYHDCFLLIKIKTPMITENLNSKPCDVKIKILNYNSSSNTATIKVELLTNNTTHYYAHPAHAYNTSLTLQVHAPQNPVYSTKFAPLTIYTTSIAFKGRKQKINICSTTTTIEDEISANKITVKKIYYSVDYFKQENETIVTIYVIENMDEYFYLITVALTLILSLLFFELIIPFLLGWNINKNLNIHNVTLKLTIAAFAIISTTISGSTFFHIPESYMMNIAYFLTIIPVAIILELLALMIISSLYDDHQISNTIAQALILYTGGATIFFTLYAGNIDLICISLSLTNDITPIIQGAELFYTISLLMLTSAAYLFYREITKKESKKYSKSFQ